MGAPYVSQATRRAPFTRCGGCDRLVPRERTTTAEGVRLCQSCAMLYALGASSEGGTIAAALRAR